MAEDAVVAIDKAEVTALPPGVTLLGDRPHEACAGSPLQVSLTAEANDPPSGETVRV